MKCYWLTCCVLSLAIGGCCGGKVIADEPSLQSAKSQLNAAPNPLDAIKKLSEQTSADSAEELASKTPLPPSADVLSLSDKPINHGLAPLPDPISTPPVVTFSKTVNAVERKERLPRGLLLVGKHCSPCDRMQIECLDLIGGKEAPIEAIQVELANELDELGVTPSMMIHGTPLLVVLAKDGKIHSLTPSGFGCYLSGFHNRGDVIKYLSLPEHGVDLTPAQDSSAVVATVEGGEASPELFAAVLAAHLMESSGQETDDSPVVMGSLFDFTVEIDQSWKSLAQKILTAQKIEFPSAGLTIDFSGANRSFSQIDGDGTTTLKLNPPVKATVQKWVFSWSAALNSVTCADDLSYMQIDMSGCPDVTINLVSKKVATNRTVKQSLHVALGLVP